MFTVPLRPCWLDAIKPDSEAFSSTTKCAAYPKLTFIEEKAKLLSVLGAFSANHLHKRLNAAGYLKVIRVGTTVPVLVLTVPSVSLQTDVTPAGSTLERLLFCLKYQSRRTSRTSSSLILVCCSRSVANVFAALRLRGIAQIQRNVTLQVKDRDEVVTERRVSLKKVQ